MSRVLQSVSVRFEHDVVLARQRARQLATLLGFERQDQTRFATAVSEIARNAYMYAGGGKVEFLFDLRNQPQTLLARVQDEGPGIGDLVGVLQGTFRSTTGLGQGLVGVRHLMDVFHVDSGPNGTTVVFGKPLPASVAAVTAARLDAVLGELARTSPESPFEEMQAQNQELLRALDELRARQDELVRLNRELEDTNRGVVALYAELDEKADHLRRADELKTRFLSNMSHEFRTPLNSMLALSRLLLDRADGELTGEQERQVRFIRKAAEDLLELVNDLLDIAKVEAGKITIRTAEFEVSGFFGALRGMLRPLLLGDQVKLVFEDPPSSPPVVSDEGKVSQILRNFISNALKFTERGEVRVSAAFEPAHDTVTFTVADTGIGIAAGDLETIFEEFTQVESDRQRRVKGTGLGLPLSRRLAGLLGGSVSVESEPGHGSTFRLMIPREWRPAVEGESAEQIVASKPDDTRYPVLVVEDNRETLFLYEKYLRGTGFEVIAARTAHEARRALATLRPVAVVLDVLLPGGESWGLLAEIKSEPRTRDLPVVVATIIDEPQRGLALGADDFAVKPIERRWLLGRLREFAGRGQVSRVLVVDDEEVSRYLLKGLLADTRFEIREAADGLEGLAMARTERPDVILLDLVMPKLNGFEVLRALKADPATRDIPVIVCTSKILEDEERAQLTESAVAVLAKESTSRETALAHLRDALVRATRGVAAPAGGWHEQ
ncbi:MAG: response regulator [Acidobacteriota bacterium]